MLTRLAIIRLVSIGESEDDWIYNLHNRNNLQNALHDFIASSFTEILSMHLKSQLQLAIGELRHLRERSRFLIGHLREIASSAPPTQLLPVAFACFLFQYWFLTEQCHDHIRQREKRDCTAFKRFLREDTDELLLVFKRLGRDVTVSWHWRCVFDAFVVICCGDLPKASTQEFWHSLYWLLHCFPFAAVSLEFLYYTKEQFAAIYGEFKISALSN